MPRFICALVVLCACCVAAGAGWVFAETEWRLRRTYAPVVRRVLVSGDRASVTRGEHLVRAIGNCTWCHGEDLGGRELLDVWAIGRLHAPNLTPGEGGISDWSDEALLRALRHGVGSDGRPLLLLPAQYLRHLTDSDAAAIIAYLRTLPWVARVGRPRRVGPLSRLALWLGRVPDVLPAETVADLSCDSRAVPESASPEYGRYLVDVASCRLCHRDDLGGGEHPLAVPGEPTPPDLRRSRGLRGWTRADFATALRTGRTPEGRALDPRFMPWTATARLSDTELDAIWTYLGTR